MTAKTDDTLLTGEQRLRRRKYRFIRYCAWAAMLACVVGLASGAAVAFYEDARLPGWVLIAMWAIIQIGFAWFTYDYFHRIDELDLLDNLWATTIGFYFYLVLFVTWYVFAEVEMVPPVDDFAILSASLAAVFLAYAARKLGWR